MLLKELREYQCGSFNVIEVGSIEMKGNKMAKLAGFLLYEIHETETQSFATNYSDKYSEHEY